MTEETREAAAAQPEVQAPAILCGFVVAMLENGALHVQPLTPEENGTHRQCSQADIGALCRMVTIHQELGQIGSVIMQAARSTLTIPGNGNGGGNPMANRLRQMFGRKGHR